MSQETRETVDANTYFQRVGQVTADVLRDNRLYIEQLEKEKMAYDQQLADALRDNEALVRQRDELLEAAKEVLKRDLTEHWCIEYCPTCASSIARLRSAVEEAGK